jgi:hypothetical protein
MPVVNGTKVTFSAKSRLYMGEYGTADAALAAIGLLGQDAQMNLEQTFRQKMDGFPEVPAAEAIQAQNGSMDAVLREWKKDALLLALGLHSTDITEAAGGDTVVAAAAGDAVTFDATTGVAVLPHPIKSGTALTGLNTAADGTGTASVEGTDYFLVERDPEGRTLLVLIAGGNITAGDTLYAAYTWTEAAYEEYPIGTLAQVRYWTLRFEEDLTNGGRSVLYFPKARVGIRGSLAFNSRDQGADLPVTISAIYDDVTATLMKIRNYPTAP